MFSRSSSPRRSSGGFRSSRPQGRSQGGSFGSSRGRTGYVQKTYDPSFYIKKAKDMFQAEPENVTEVVGRPFAEFDLHPTIQENIKSRGYGNSTPIQDQAIPAALEGRDVVGLAKTGSGKTAAFLLPLINKIMANPEQKALIIAPTRELAVQIEEELRIFARGSGLRGALCIGGVGMFPQVQKMRKHPHFVIGTPGRLRDLENQGELRFDEYQNIVLDEVDRMLDMGFINEVRYIIDKLPTERQTLFFSATMTDSVIAVMRSLLRDPLQITIETKNNIAHIQQDVVRAGSRPKLDVLCDILGDKDCQKSIIFLRTKHGTEKLGELLEARGVRIISIHGNKSQSQRQRAIQMFKQDRVSVMLATDVASRGLDIDDISHVINYDLPESHEDYIHRIGRTGRANKTGKAITFVD